MGGGQHEGYPGGSGLPQPNSNPDISRIDGLLDMIQSVSEMAGEPIGIKAVISLPGWLNELCERVNERGLQYTPTPSRWTAATAPQDLVEQSTLLNWQKYSFRKSHASLIQESPPQIERLFLLTPRT